MTTERDNQTLQSDSAGKTPLVYLGLGSNLGDREANLREAVGRIESLGIEITRSSSIYETEPVGHLDQPWFLNQVIEAAVRSGIWLDHAAAGPELEGEGQLDWALTLWACRLLEAVLGIERAMGRERTITDGPRLIDIDILVCGDAKGFWVETSGDNIARAAGAPFLILPHPRMHLRRFVLEPLCEITPGLMHSTLGKRVRELLEALDDTSIVRPYHSASS